MAKKLTLKKLMDPKFRDSLSDAQLVHILNQLKGMVAGLGKPNVEDDIAEFAVRLSGGAWRAADHLRLLSTYLGKLERREIRFLTVSMPPRHGKSLLIDTWLPIWWLTRKPEARVILAGYGDQFARQWGGDVRDKIIEHSEDLNLLISKDRNAADDWTLQNAGGGMLCVGVGGALTGRGADLLIIDDPVKNAEEANSLIYRDRMWNWWQTAAFTRLQPDGVAIVVATRWHEDDLIGRILKNDELGLWHQLRLPAIAEKEDPLGRAEGAPLWPQQFKDDPDYRIRRGSMLEYWWNALYQGRPTPEGGGLIQRDWFRFYSERPEDILDSCDQAIQTWDPALSDKVSADFWVGQIWARKGSSLYLITQTRGHYTLAQAMDIMRKWSIAYPKAIAKLVENTAMGPAMKQTLHHEVPGIIPVPAKGTKRSRIESTTPYLMAGNVYLPESPSGLKPKWVQEFIEECAAYPTGTHDDIPDAMAQGITFLNPAAWRQLREDARRAESEATLTEEEQAEFWREQRRNRLNPFIEKVKREMDGKEKTKLRYPL